VADHFVADGTPIDSLGGDRVFGVAGGRENAGVNDEGVAVGLGGLVVVAGVADVPRWAKKMNRRRSLSDSPRLSWRPMRRRNASSVNQRSAWTS
jgi:hypothetical protein